MTHHRRRMVVSTPINGPDGNETNAWAPDGQCAQMVGGMYVPITGGSSATNTSFPLRPIYDLMGNPIADTGNSGTRAVARYRVYGPGIDEPLAETRPGNEIDYLHHDALGSITCATDATGFVSFRNSYRAFGQRTFTDIAKPLFFSHTRLSYTSRENSVGTMYQYRSRYYDSGVGRFAQQDGWRGQASAPPSMHRYAYTINNPTNFADPLGETSVRMPAHMDDLLGRTFDVIAVLFAILAVAGISRNPAVGTVFQ